jgi:hypothetical protein
MSGSRSMVPVKRSPGGAHEARTSLGVRGAAVKPPTWLPGHAADAGQRATSNRGRIARARSSRFLERVEHTAEGNVQPARVNALATLPRLAAPAGSSQTNLDLERSASRDDADLARGAAAPNPNLDPAPIVARVRRGLTPVVWHKVVDAQRYVHVPPAPDRSAGSRAIALLMRSAKRRETCGARSRR